VQDVHAREPLAVPPPAPSELAVEPLAGRVHVEGPARAVGAVQPGRQADDREPGPPVAEAWHGPVPIVGAQRARLGQEGGEPRAAVAAGDLPLDLAQRRLTSAHLARNLRRICASLKLEAPPVDVPFDQGGPRMRAGLVYALVLGSLVFSVGGVAVVGQADGS